jgi:hypothetical protein
VAVAAAVDVANTETVAVTPTQTRKPLPAGLRVYVRKV